MIVFLVFKRCRYLYGQTIELNGGLFMV